MKSDQRRENYFRQNRSFSEDRLTAKQRKRIRLRSHREGAKA